MQIQRERQFDLSGGPQSAPSFLVKQNNSVYTARNAVFNQILGAAVGRGGYAIEGDPFSTTKPPRGYHVARFREGPVRMVAVENSGGTATLIRTQAVDGTWTTLISDLPPNMEVFFFDFLNETYVSGYDRTTLEPVQPRNIAIVSGVLDVSLSRNLLNCPACHFFVEYGGLLYAANVTANNVRYPDRVYKSSPPTSVFTFVRGAQTDVYATETLVDNVPTMTDYSAPFGTASASSEVNTGNRAWQAFDDNPGPPSTGGASRWISATTTGWLKYDFGSGNAKTISHYSLVGENSSETVNRGPKSWTFEGSNDNTNWDVLDTRTNVSTWNAASAEKRTYAIINSTAYRYYRLNISANQGADYVAVQELELLTSNLTTRTQILKIDSTRYTKVGTQIEVYAPNSNVMKYALTVQSVDKQNNTINFIPQSNTFATGAVNTTNETITLPSTTPYVTGVPIKFDSTGSVPGGLTADTLYYAIQASSTTIKVATSYSNALLGNAINLTSTGSGTSRVRLSYVFNDNDEIVLAGRRNKIGILWNTDWLTPETADFIAIQPGTDSNNAITAAAKTSSRLLLFTENSGNSFDGQNLHPFNNAIGCISQRVLKNIDDDWLIWVDSQGKVRARNESSGQQEFISRAIHNDIMSKLTQDNFDVMNAVVYGSRYKLYLGTVGEKEEILRVVYDFDSNTWEIESHKRPILMQATDRLSGVELPFFVSDPGVGQDKYLYRDETGDLDVDKGIPFLLQLGRNNQGHEGEKFYAGVKIYSENASGLKIMARIDYTGPFKTVGQISKDVQMINFQHSGSESVTLPEGTSIDIKIVGSIKKERPIIYGIVTYFTIREVTPGNGTNK